MHFAVVLNSRMTGLRFNVPELQKFKEARGEKFGGTWVKFDNGLLDTKADGYTEEEAEAIRKRLEKMKMHDISFIENEEKEKEVKVRELPAQMRFSNQKKGE